MLLKDVRAAQNAMKQGLARQEETQFRVDIQTPRTDRNSRLDQNCMESTQAEESTAVAC